MVALILAAFALSTVQVYFQYGGARRALGLFGVGLIVVWAVSRWLARKATMRMRWMQSQSANLVATRGIPSVWLVAHLDSKSQTIRMLVRIGSIVLVGVLSVLFAIALVLDLFRVTPDYGGLEIAVVGEVLAVALLPLIACFTANKSPGAVDNASGVISVILATRTLQSRPNLGVVITSGEELGLAGARAFVESHHDRTIALNCDTIDDDGEFRCMGRGTREGAAAVRRAASRLAINVPVKGMIPGILADSIAFANAGWDSITLSRGNIATLARVHTSSDTRERLTGTGIAKAARLLAATVEELT